jgi:hypothetical protein
MSAPYACCRSAIWPGLDWVLRGGGGDGGDWRSARRRRANSTAPPAAATAASVQRENDFDRLEVTSAN